MMDLGRDIAPFAVEVDRRVEKDLRGVPRFIVERFLAALDELEIDPLRPRAGFDVKPLKDFPGNSHRLRIGDYRVLYAIDVERRLVRVTSIRHRSDAY
jgi:mRNA interferase RelE/StbE